MAHALLSPSSASRWLECTPSARLEAKKSDRAGDAADEGTLAHKLSEAMLEYELKLCTKTAFKEKVKAIEKNKFYSDEMWEYCDQFKVFVMERYAEAQMRSQDALIFLEQQINLTEWIPEGFGTRDVAIVADSVVDIIDLKYGKGIKVDAEENKQMMLYGLGTLEEYDMLYDISKVRMTIYQPRIDNFSSWEIEADNLRMWADEVLRPKAKLAWQGKGEFSPGNHCQFCRVKTTCKANADYQMVLAAHEFAEPAELSDEELVDIFNRGKAFKNWINAVESEMLRQSLQEEKKWPGLKLVEGKSAGRKIMDAVKVINAFKKAKIDETEYMSKPELLGITKLDKNIGKAEVARLIGKWLDTPPGKPALVGEDDSRPEWHSNDAAALAFDDDIVND